MGWWSLKMRKLWWESPNFSFSHVKMIYADNTKQHSTTYSFHLHYIFMCRTFHSSEQIGVSFDSAIATICEESCSSSVHPMQFINVCIFSLSLLIENERVNAHLSSLTYHHTLYCAYVRCVCVHHWTHKHERQANIEHLEISIPQKKDCQMILFREVEASH